MMTSFRCHSASPSSFLYAQTIYCNFSICIGSRSLLVHRTAAVQGASSLQRHARHENSSFPRSQFASSFYFPIDTPTSTSTSTSTSSAALANGFLSSCSCSFLFFSFLFLCSLLSVAPFLPSTLLSALSFVFVLVRNSYEIKFQIHSING